MFTAIAAPPFFPQSPEKNNPLTNFTKLGNSS